MVAVPDDTPNTTPLNEPTRAIAVLLLLHMPPLVALLSVTEAPTHMLVVPVIAAGKGLTVIVRKA
jgi:hypothetical protein